MKSRKYVPYFHDKEGQSLLAVSRKRAFKRKMYARFREKKGRASKMYQQGTETFTLEAVWTLHDTHKSIEERIYLINEGCLVCSECGITQPHIVSLQAHRIKVHGPKRLRAASRVLLREHSPEALRIKADRFSSFMALYEFCTMEAHLQRAQASAMAGGPPWPQPTFRSPPHPTPFPGIATKLIPSQATPAPPINPQVDSVSEPFKILLDLGPERAGYATIPCPPDSSFQAFLGTVGNTLGVPGENLLLKDSAGETTPITDREGLDRAQRVAVSLSLPP